MSRLSGSPFVLSAGAYLLLTRLASGTQPGFHAVRGGMRGTEGRTEPAEAGGVPGCALHGPLDVARRGRGAHGSIRPDGSRRVSRLPSGMPGLPSSERAHSPRDARPGRGGQGRAARAALRWWYDRRFSERRRTIRRARLTSAGRRSVRERLRPGAPLLYHRRRHRRPSTGCVCPNPPCWSCPARAPSPPCRSRASAPALEVCTGLEPSAAPIAAERPSCAPFLADRAWSSGPRAWIQGFPCFAVTSAFRIVIDAPCLPLP
ncbi:uncharacterized protein SOCEGT47_015930 [Sorangium cellulosum]|uniref:Uncharacterized protein n=1 Tax=Sorangium cellulosum TaxID=56 RepID=A0A4P2PW92_SORCE|nr:uncharacterized protein SOCEGT47_015930 [Sorangium cellulosum]